MDRGTAVADQSVSKPGPVAACEGCGTRAYNQHQTAPIRGASTTKDVEGYRSLDENKALYVKGTQETAEEIRHCYST